MNIAGDYSYVRCVEGDWEVWIREQGISRISPSLGRITKETLFPNSGAEVFGDLVLYPSDSGVIFSDGARINHINRHGELSTLYESGTAKHEELRRSSMVGRLGVNVVGDTIFFVAVRMSTTRSFLCRYQFPAEDLSVINLAFPGGVALDTKSEHAYTTFGYVDGRRAVVRIAFADMSSVKLCGAEGYNSCELSPSTSRLVLTCPPWERAQSSVVCLAERVAMEEEKRFEGGHAVWMPDSRHLLTVRDEFALWHVDSVSAEEDLLIRIDDLHRSANESYCMPPVVSHSSGGRYVAWACGGFDCNGEVETATIILDRDRKEYCVCEVWPVNMLVI